MSAREWAAHPLNRYRGGLLGVVIAALLGLAAAVAVAVASITGAASVLPYPIVEPSLMLAGLEGGKWGLLLLALWQRWSMTPWVFTGAAILAREGRIALDLLFYTPDIHQVVEYEVLLIIDLAIAAYLFFSLRASVVFRRRTNR